jgi:hypothetical protein
VNVPSMLAPAVPELRRQNVFFVELNHNTITCRSLRVWYPKAPLHP